MEYFFGNELLHYGTPRRSGRYPYGSGENPYQDNANFLGYINKLRDEGMSESDIAKNVNMNTSDLRKKRSLAITENRAADAAFAFRLKEKGVSVSEIARRMGKNESSIRSLLDVSLSVKNDITKATSEALKDSISKNKYIDIGKGTEYALGVSRTKLNTAIEKLKEEGYTVNYIKVEQKTNPGKFTSVKVLAAPGLTYKDIYNNRDKISLIGEYSEDNGLTFNSIKPINSISSDRVAIRYSDDTPSGNLKDGVIELRRGVEDISLGSSNYAQVRIGVDGTHYLKGMALYSDDLPKGVDVLFNTNKSKNTPMIIEDNKDKKEEVLKPMQNDPIENPKLAFGATIRQRTYIGSDGKEHLSAINIVNEEGKWDDWSKNLSAQFLSKQPTKLAKKQLDLQYDNTVSEFEEINSYTNPAVKKRLMAAFADECDSQAVHLKAAAMPRQRTKVILPITSLKDNEVYAPGYRNGESVVLIRYPHAGPFEIPNLIVKNKNKEGIDIIGNSKDAIGINSKVAAKLSGADFDGDSVIVIPNPNKEIKYTSSLAGLKDFDPKVSYPAYEGMTTMTKTGTQHEMGKISNLITDMTIKGASTDEICRAVRHSMVVIDANKHNLNYKQSFSDNGIAQLKQKYQGGSNKGASTIISQSASEINVPERKANREYNIDPETGKKIFNYTGDTKAKVFKDSKTGNYIYSKEETVPRTSKSTKMYETEDARTLVSDDAKPIELVYANFANKMKALANKARKIVISTRNIERNPGAAKTYSKEVASLNSKLNIALKNSPLERKAQLLADVMISKIKTDNPDIKYDKSAYKKAKANALEQARKTVGSGKKSVDITQKEWEAIQSGALSQNKVGLILDNTDLDLIKQYALPKTLIGISDSKLSRAKSMLNNGYSTSEVADAIGVSVSKLQSALEKE